MDRSKQLRFLGFLATAMLVLRLFFGVDLLDESYYAAMTLKFARGGIAFRDEMILHQITYLFLRPIAWVWDQCFGTTGVVLFLRFMFLSLWIGLSRVVSFCLRGFFNEDDLKICRFVMLSVIPLNIPSISYNSAAIFLFTLFLFLLFRQNISPLSSSAKFFMGFSFILLCEIYPPLVIPLVAALGIDRLVSKQFSFCRYSFWGALLGVVWILPDLVMGREQLRSAVYYSATGFSHGGGVEKLVKVFVHLFWRNLGLNSLFFWTMGVVVLVSRKRLNEWVAISVFVVLGILFWRAPTRGNWWFLYLGLLLPLFGNSEFSIPQKRLYWIVGVPSWIAGIMTAYASASSSINAVVGMFPAAIVGLMFLTQRQSEKTKFWVSFGLALFLVWGNFFGRAFYGEKDVIQLSHRIKTGPFAGIATTPEKFQYIKTIESQIHSGCRVGARVAFYEFPAGYLMCGNEPGSPTGWMRRVSAHKELYWNFYQSRIQNDDRFFIVKKIYLESLRHVIYSPEDLLIEQLKRTHEIESDTEFAVTYRPK